MACSRTLGGEHRFRRENWKLSTRVLYKDVIRFGGNGSCWVLYWVSSREMAHSLAGRQARDSPNIPVPTAFRLWWHRRAMYATEATGLPLLIQWYGAQICKASSGLKHDKYCSRLCLWQAWPQTNSVEQSSYGPNHLQKYADVISAKGSPLDNCFGFVYGTVRPISRPGQHQRAVYNGHKGVHALKISICCSTEWVNRKPIWPNR